MTGTADGPSRLVHVRLTLDVLIDTSNHEFIETRAASAHRRVADVVASEVVSSLESVTYVESVVATES